MPLCHVVPLTPSVSLRLSHLLCHKENEQSNFHSPYTLPSSVSRKSFACHSYENTGGVGVFFPFWNSSNSLTTLSSSFLFIRLRIAKSCNALALIFIPNCRGTPLRRSDSRTSGSSNHVSIYPLSIQALAHSFALKKIPTPLLSIDSALFAKNHPGWGEGVQHLFDVRRSTLDVQTFGRSDAFLISPKVLYFQYRER
jgi:hypothetical protein